MVKRIIIIGATSGIGYEVAKIYWKRGYQLGLAGRRVDRLEEFRKQDPEHIQIKQLDVTAEDAADRLDELIRDLGGMDIFLLSSGIGNQNKYLDTSIEQATIQTNVTGFTRMVLAAYRYFSSQGGGHISVISSIAGTKGFITFTDIRPGFVRTDLLKDGRNYPMLMSPQYAALRIANAIDRKKRRAIIDWRYAILVFLWRLIPEWLWERLPIRN